MVTVLALLGVVVVLFGAAALATRGGGELAPAPPDAADLALPPGPVRATDVSAVRFSMAPRGYRMAEVDAALERLAEELRDRDRRIGLLEAAAEGRAAPQVPAAGPGDPLVAPLREAGPDDLPVPPSTAGPAGAASPLAGH